MVKLKQQYVGIFNFQRQRYIEYCYAYTPRQAWFVICRRIAKIQGVIPSMVINYFNDNKDRYKIELETEWKEDL